jgi:hypothetical protein
MVAFFLAPKCPFEGGWEPYEKARGRYFVGINDPTSDALGKQIGMSLRDEENRPTGAHTHKFTAFTTGKESFTGGALTYVFSGHGGFERSTVTQDTMTAQAGNGDLAPGTNAPYVLLLACIHK